MNRFDVISITYRCPMCKKEYTENGKNSSEILWCVIDCPCGFTGEIVG